MKSIRDVGSMFSEHLDTVSINLIENDDGRTESQMSEVLITESLEDKFGDVVEFLPKNHNRSFGDIDIKIGNKVYPINIKMVDSTKSSSYNGGGPKVFNYILFGEPKDTNWKCLITRITKKFPEKIQKEYFYLIYYKCGNMATKFISLTDIHSDSLIANPSNPIQLKKDLKEVRRTEKEKVSFLMNFLMEIHEKRATPYLMLKELVW